MARNRRDEGRGGLRRARETTGGIFDFFCCRARDETRARAEGELPRAWTSGRWNN